MRKTVVLFSLFSFAASGSSQSRRFSADDLTKIVRIGDQRISPDGKTISIVVGRANLKEDRWDSEIASDPLRSRDVWRRWTAWLAQYLNEPTSTNPTTM